MNFFRTEWGKLKVMTFTEKRQYIWEYYKLHIAGILIGAFALGGMINTLILNPPRQEYVYFAWVGPAVTLQSLDDFMEELDVIVENYERYGVRAANYGLSAADPQVAVALQTRFAANFQFGNFDIFMMQATDMFDFANAGFLLPMQPFMEAVREHCTDLYNTLHPRLVLLTFYPNGVEEPQQEVDYMALNLSGVRFLERLAISTGDLYMGVAVNSQRFDRVMRALEVIFDGE